MARRGAGRRRRARPAARGLPPQVAERPRRPGAASADDPLDAREGGGADRAAHLRSIPPRVAARRAVPAGRRARSPSSRGTRRGWCSASGRLEHEVKTVAARGGARARSSAPTTCRWRSEIRGGRGGRRRGDRALSAALGGRRRRWRRAGRCSGTSRSARATRPAATTAWPAALARQPGAPRRGARPGLVDEWLGCELALRG